MVGWIILGVIVLLITLILLTPVGADFGYEQGRLHASLKLGWIKLRLFPRKKEPESDTPQPPKKKKKKKKQEKPKEEKPEQEEKPKQKRKLDITLDEIFGLLKAVLDGVSHFGRRLRVDRFVLHLVVAGYDPYNVAMTYGKVNALLSAFAPACTKLDTNNSDVWTAVDFTTEWPQIEFGMGLSFRIGVLFGVVGRIAVGAIKVLLQRRKRMKQEAKAAKAAAQLPPDTPPDTPPETPIDTKQENQQEDNKEKNEQNNEQTIQDEERTAANG